MPLNPEQSSMANHFVLGVKMKVRLVLSIPYDTREVPPLRDSSQLSGRKSHRTQIKFCRGLTFHAGAALGISRNWFDNSADVVLRLPRFGKYACESSID